MGSLSVRQDLPDLDLISYTSINKHVVYVVVNIWNIEAIGQLYLFSRMIHCKVCVCVRRTGLL